MKLIQRGSSGPEVKKWQQFLIGQGFLSTGEADGMFGKITEEASKKFQRNTGLVIDGIVGKNTILKAVEYGFEKPLKFTREVNTIVIHITASNDNATVEDIRQGHLKRGFSDIGYHLLVGRDGTIYPGRDREKIGAHVEGHNVGTFAIAYIARGSDNEANAPFGKFMTDQQKNGLIEAVRNELANYNLSADNVRGHNDYTSGKACPCFKVGESKEFLKSIS